MRLNLDYYKEDTPYKMEKNEEIIIEYIKTKTQDEIEDIIREKLDDNTILKSRYENYLKFIEKR